MFYAIALANEIELVVQKENAKVIKNILDSGKKVTKVTCNDNSIILKYAPEVTVTDSNARISFTRDQIVTFKGLEKLTKHLVSTEISTLILPDLDKLDFSVIAHLPRIQSL